MKNTILVTGSAGFIGSHLVDHLIDHGYRVFGVDDLSGGFTQNVNPKSDFLKLDLRRKKETEAVIKKIKPGVIFHLAADASEGRSQFTPLSSTERNYLAYMNLLIPAIENDLKKIVVVSSMSVYGNQKSPFSEDMEPSPVDIYGIAKAAMEKATEILAKVHGFSYSIIRPHNVYGPKQNLKDPYRNVIGIFINSLLRKKPFYIYGDGEQKRAFSYIDDVAPYIAKAGFEEKCDGQIVNIGAEPEEAVTINKLSEIILDKFFKGKVPSKFKPLYALDRPQEVKEAFCTSDKAKKILGYKTSTSLESGIEKTISWAKSVGPQKPRYLKRLELETGNVPETWKKHLI